MSTRELSRDAEPARLSRIPRRWGWVLVASSIWTLWVWITRVNNIARQDQTTQFKVAHYVLAGVSVLFAAAVGVVGVRLLKLSRTGS